MSAQSVYNYNDGKRSTAHSVDEGSSAGLSRKSRAGSLRRPSAESTSSSTKTSQQLKAAPLGAALATGKPKGKLGRRKGGGEDHADDPELRATYEAEVFQLRECMLKDEREAASLEDQVAEQKYLVKKAENHHRELSKKLEEQAVLSKANEENLERQLVDMSQAHQRLVERYSNLEKRNKELEETAQQLRRDIVSQKGVIKELNGDVREVKHAASTVEDALRKAISIAQRENYDLRMMHTRQEEELVCSLDDVQGELQAVVERIDRSIVPFDVRNQAAQDFHEAVGLVTIRYRNLLEKCRLQSSRFSDSLLRVSSLHTNLPPHIKETLVARTPEMLVQLIDNLSFEVNVKECLEAMFPPTSDLSFLRKKYPHTPSAAMIHGEVFADRGDRNSREADTAPKALYEDSLKLAAGIGGREPNNLPPGAKYLTPLSQPPVAPPDTNVITEGDSPQG